MWEPFVRASRRRRREISCGARPGDVVEEGRIWEIWMGVPVRVLRRRRVRMLVWVLRRRGGVGGLRGVSLVILWVGGRAWSWCFVDVDVVCTAACRWV